MPVLALPFPTVDPVIFEVGPFALRWYALSYIVGILLAWRYMRLAVQKDRLWQAVPRPGLVDIDDFVTWGTIGIIVGGRLGYVLVYDPLTYLANPVEIFAVWNGGMAFHGGFAGTVLAMVLFARARGIPLLTLFDLAGIAAPIGLFFGRLANFINDELWGRPTDVPWAVEFPSGGYIPRHPSQLYEAALEGVLLFLVLRLMSHRFGLLQKPGFLAGAFAAGYGITRSIAEEFRMPDAQIGFLPGGFTMGMLLSGPMIIAGIALMVWSWRRARAA